VTAPRAAAALEVSERPWGRFTTLDQGNGYKVKRLEVFPAKRLSYQTHASRCEHWVIVAGAGVVTLDGHELHVGAGDQVLVPIGTPHRIANVGSDLLVFIEVQRGTYLGEDDIVRLEDDFGRA